jgi:hypothetical protein
MPRSDGLRVTATRRNVSWVTSLRDLLDLRTGDRVRSWTPDRHGRSATYFDQVWEYTVAPRRDGGDMLRPLFLQTG